VSRQVDLVAANPIVRKVAAAALRGGQDLRDALFIERHRRLVRRIEPRVLTVRWRHGCQRVTPKQRQPLGFWRKIFQCQASDRVTSLAGSRTDGNGRHHAERVERVR